MASLDLDSCLNGDGLEREGEFWVLGAVVDEGWGGGTGCCPRLAFLLLEWNTK